MLLSANKPVFTVVQATVSSLRITSSCTLPGVQPKMLLEAPLCVNRSKEIPTISLNAPSLLVCSSPELSRIHWMRRG